MAKAPPARGLAKPPIHLSEADYDVIAGLALRMEQRDPDLAEQILDEVNRARIHAPGSLPEDVVAIGSEVEFLDDSNGEKRRLRLVLPAEADIEAGRISVMTPVGAGLIGMSTGREIDWPTPDGRPRTLRILEVKQEP
jgi:regulator of nucleoside diphosphate kinase